MNDEIETYLNEVYTYRNWIGNNFIMADYSMEPYRHLSKIDIRNIEVIYDPDTVLKNKRGSCYDQSFLVRNKMLELGVETKVFYSFTLNLKKENNICFFYPGFISHMFVVCKFKNKWKWVEWSWDANIKNSFDNENIIEVLKNYQNVATKSWHYPMKIFEIKDIKFPCLRLDILNKYANEQEIILNS